MENTRKGPSTREGRGETNGKGEKEAMITMGHFVRKGAREFSDRVAIKYMGKEQTFSQVNERTNRLANGLMSAGVEKGERIAILLDNCPQWIETDFAIMKTGAVRVGLNVRLSMQEHEYSLKDSEAGTVIVGQKYLEGILGIKPNVPSLKRVICLGEGGGKSLNFEEIISQGSSKEPQVEVDENDVFRIAYTSGTTGRPKGVTLTHKAAKHTMLNMLLGKPVFRDDVYTPCGAAEPRRAVPTCCPIG